MIDVYHGIPGERILLGLLRAEGISPAAGSRTLESRLSTLLDVRTPALTDREETIRNAVRDTLRNGRYKPTGRGKPASEYLLRAADPGAETGFPRVNAPVDVCNYISLKHLVPISLWDLDRAASVRYNFRLGRPGESYVFNAGGQAIDLEDLVVGCRVVDGRHGEPIVNPVKDSLLTKTTPETRHVAASVYAPAQVVSPVELEDICAEFAELLSELGASVAWRIARPEETVAL